jgi:hypothetical protein
MKILGQVGMKIQEYFYYGLIYHFHMATAQTQVIPFHKFSV